MTARRLNTVARVTRALEAIAAGNQPLAVAVLEDLRREISCGPVRYRCRCEGCGTVFEWPGLLDYHLQVSSCGRRAA